MAKLVVGQNDLASQCPEVAAEWDYEKNGDVTPEMVCYKSSKKYWWICSKHGVSWETKVTVRTRGHGCPQCAHDKKVSTNGTLADRFPEIAAEWHPTLNGDLTPNDVTGSTSTKVWWLGRCGHEWDMTVANRTTLGQGCPFCAGKRVLAGFNDLSTTDPNVADEWDYERNGDLKPTAVSRGSAKVVWWKCGSCGFSWQGVINKRTARNEGCPSCRVSVKRTIRKPTHGMTLADAHPDVAAEWHPTKNGDLTPSDVAANSHRSVWWVCQSGHEWQTVIKNRNREKSGCPICGLSRHASFPEKAIAYYLGMVFDDVQENVRTGKPGLEKLELDILVPSIGTAVEYDGQRWHTRTSCDIKKDLACDENGIRVIRIREPKCATYESPATFIVREDATSPKSLDKAIEQLLFLLGKDGRVSVDTEADSAEIYDMLNRQYFDRSLQSVAPDIAAEWHPTKNAGMTPAMFTTSSNHRAWWICPNGHEYQTRIAHRTSGHGCPQCSHAASAMKLRKTHEQFCEELSAKNPTIVAIGEYRYAREKTTFRCLECGEEFEATPDNMLRGNGCPKCRYKRASETRRRNTVAKRGMKVDFSAVRRNVASPTAV